jgi:glutathione S-transferase
MTGPITFYDWPHSPFCMKVRKILDIKGLDYRAVSPLGAGMRTIRRGGIGKVPAIEMDGRLLVDSTDIAHALEDRFPAAPILPADPAERGRCHALEDWADESLYFIGLYYRWLDREGRAPVPAAFGRSLTGRIAYRVYLRRILGQLRGQGTSRKPPAHVRADLERHLAAVAGMVDGQPFLLGQRPWLCDIALWGQLEYLRRTPVGGRAMTAHPAVLAYIKRIAALGTSTTP